MDKPTLEGFKAYALKRGADKINNESWRTCAVGEYLQSLGINSRDDEDLFLNMVKDKRKDAVSNFYQELEAVAIKWASCDDDDIITLGEVLNCGMTDTYEDLVNVMTTCEVGVE